MSLTINHTLAELANPLSCLKIVVIHIASRMRDALLFLRVLQNFPLFFQQGILISKGI